MPEQPDNHHHDGNQKNENRDPVHAMHEPDICIVRVLGIAFFEVEIRQDLVADAHGWKRKKRIQM